ncbi:pantoate--beta-alanine ligase [Dyadobacter sp. 32]|uniref:pantoate--beta-alanine ligase n=1 Tax=Dyadobacter sp. 32 TaxID=538966 RepID=UPI0011EC9964
MEVFTSINDLKSFLKLQRAQNKSVGLVPTMGALHPGHMSLIKTSTTENDLTIGSVFVNPVQFNNAQDLEKYPRTLEADCIMLEEAGCSAVFAPTVEEMYAEKPLMRLDFGDLENVMEGASRPGHFNGVGIVVARFFNIVQPDKAYFGQKDLQQVAVIKRLVKDMAFPLELVVCETVREIDGLAMSSRNSRLSKMERVSAPFIYKTLAEAKNRLLAGDSIESVAADARTAFLKHQDFQLDYLEIVNNNSLQPITRLGPAGSSAICTAVYLGAVRLIDNILL